MKDAIIKHIDLERAYKLSELISDWNITALSKGQDRKDLNEAVVLSLSLAKALEVRHDDLAAMNARLESVRNENARLESLIKDKNRRIHELLVDLKKRDGEAFEPKKKTKVGKIDLFKQL